MQIGIQPVKKWTKKPWFVHPEILKYLNDKFYIVKFNSGRRRNRKYIYDRVFKNPEFQVKSKGKMGRISLLNL